MCFTARDFDTAMHPAKPYRFEVRANNSLTPRGAGLFLLLSGIACLGPALTLVALGYWPVLPFAGAEFAGLSAATWWSLRNGRYHEIITVQPTLIRIDKFSASTHTRMEFPLHWTTARLVAGPSRWSPQKLLLRTGMRECEVASCATESDRVVLWRQLHALIGPINQTPQPPSTGT